MATSTAAVVDDFTLARPGAAAEPMGYFAHTLFRRDAALTTPPSADTPASVAAPDKARQAAAYAALWLFVSRPRRAAASATSDPASTNPYRQDAPMRSLQLLFLGSPIPIVILIALFVH